MTSTRSRSGRQPRLRVIAPTLPRGRHTTAMYREYSDGSRENVVIEVFPFAEWERIPPHARPAEVSFVPGIGYITADFGVPNEEAQDVADMVGEAKDFHYGVSW